MKQRISESQFNSLSPEKQEEIKQWGIDTKYYIDGLPLLTIGEMIDYLKQKRDMDIYSLLTDVLGRFLDEDNLTDALWEAIKSDE